MNLKDSVRGSGVPGTEGVNTHPGPNTRGLAGKRAILFPTQAST